MALTAHALAMRDEVNAIRKRKEAERAENTARMRAEIKSKEIRDTNGALTGYTDQEPGGDRFFPYPVSCGTCACYVKERGGPEHQYGLMRGHGAHCTCDGCW